MLIFDGTVKNDSQRELLVEEFREFVLFLYIMNMVFLIFVNNSDDKLAQMVTGVHEFVRL
jgi:hypothetical protein